MKLSADKTTYRASGIMARDARHVHNGPEAPRAVRGKKDRKRWCGGHVGREHKPVCLDYVTAKQVDRQRQRIGCAFYQGWKLLVCTKCGKELARYCPWRPERETPPAWVPQ